MKILCIVEVVELHEDKVGSFPIIFKIVREMKSSCKNGSLPEKSGELACLELHMEYVKEGCNTPVKNACKSTNMLQILKFSFYFYQIFHEYRTYLLL